MTEIRIGKTVIETLTSGMYEDARFVYREYIQNAADQIDKAVELGIFSNKRDGKIHISIDSVSKSITFEDNATGIRSDEFYSTLANIALSSKDRTKNKGFRGIGRLGGLGYCKKLIFETSYKGENIKSIMLWDAVSLHQKLNDHKLDIDAASLVTSVVFTDFVTENEESHYFKVKLVEVSNPELLDVKNIQDYLSMVAPVPLPPSFLFRKKIYDEIKKENINIDEYYIFINTDILTKGYTTSFYESNQPGKVYDEVFDIEFFKINGHNNEMLAWGWYGVSKFDKQIPASTNISRGLRLRKGNIQIGSENTLVKLHKESRGNFYFIGEIHALHQDLVPNSRRDYFNENIISRIFEKKIKELFHNRFYKLYHDANKLKNAKKKIDIFHEIKNEYNDKNTNGNFSSSQQRKILNETLDKAKSEAINKTKELQRIQNKASSDSTLYKVYDKIVGSDIIPKIEKELTNIISTKPSGSEKIYITQKLSKLDEKEEKIVRKIFELIDIMLPEKYGKELKLKIQEEYQ